MTGGGHVSGGLSRGLPRVGDILRFAQVATLHAPQANAFYFGEFIAAWHRQLSKLDCPLRLEEGAVFKRLRPEGRMLDARWKQDSSIGSEEKWRAIEYDINRRLGVSTLHMEEGLALTFLGVSAAERKARMQTRHRGGVEYA